MAPISEYKGEYIKKVITVIVITVLFLLILLFVKPDLVRCYLKPIHKETGWDYSIWNEGFLDEVAVAIGEATPTPGSMETSTPTQAPVPETTVEWNGLEKTTRGPNGSYSIESFEFSLRTVAVIAGFILSVAATLAAIGFALYFVIRSSQLKDQRALALSSFAMLFVFALGAFGCVKIWQAIRTESHVEPDSSYREMCIHAPIIYLYDEQCREVSVNLSIDGKLTHTYPKYGEGWTVKTSPDGTITDANGRKYEYLFWEADLNMDPDTSRGFCVKGEDTAAFLEKALSDLGLSDTEANTFIMYWLPQMEENPYNVISFQTEAYENAAKLEVDPLPDTIVRVNMFFYASDEYVEIEKQDLTSMNPSLEEREGFVLVEWGGETV